MKNIIIRHKKENLKKCSLRGLEKRNDLIFFKYPFEIEVDFSNCVLLNMDSNKIISKEDKDKKIVLIDSTWRYLDKILKVFPNDIETRSLPKKYITAYPRKQTLCSDPKYGLASVEALYLAYLLTDRDPQGLLDNYFWKNDFLSINRLKLKST